MRHLIVFLLLACSALAQDVGKEVVAAVLRNPGHWEQNCRVGFAPVNPLELPTRGYRRFWTDYRISAENYQKLRDHRAAVLRELSRRMLALKPQVVQQSKFEYCRLSGDLDRARKLGSGSEDFEIYLDMVQELQGVETVPVLLELEKELNARPLWMVKPSKLASWNAYGLHVQVLSVLGYLVHERTGELDFLPKYANYSSYTRNQIVAAAARL
jgi:hypothetical protein